jgi:hypothetical protein
VAQRRYRGDLFQGTADDYDWFSRRWAPDRAGRTASMATSFGLVQLDEVAGRITHEGLVTRL